MYGGYAVALTDNLISYWELGEASGGAVDSHGANTLADNNTVGSASGVGGSGTARDFNAAANEFFSKADNADLSTGDIDFTVAGWVYVNATGSTRGVLGKWDSGGSDLEYELHFNGTFNAMHFAVRDAANSASQYVISSVTLSATTWYHVVAWHDAAGNQLGVTVNAGSADTQAHPGGVRDGTAAFQLGKYDVDGCHGRLQGWGLWKRVLTSGERTTLYNGGAYLPYSSFGGAPPAGLAAPRRGRRSLGHFLTR